MRVAPSWLQWDVLWVEWARCLEQWGNQQVIFKPEVSLFFFLVFVCLFAYIKHTVEFAFCVNSLLEKNIFCSIQPLLSLFYLEQGQRARWQRYLKSPHGRRWFGMATRPESHPWLCQGLSWGGEKDSGFPGDQKGFGREYRNAEGGSQGDAGPSLEVLGCRRDKCLVQSCGGRSRMMEPWTYLLCKYLPPWGSLLGGCGWQLSWIAGRRWSVVIHPTQLAGPSCINHCSQQQMTSRSSAQAHVIQIRILCRQ
jgi:hypothetical protein